MVWPGLSAGKGWSSRKRRAPPGQGPGGARTVRCGGGRSGPGRLRDLEAVLLEDLTPLLGAEVAHLAEGPERGRGHVALALGGGDQCLDLLRGAVGGGKDAPEGRRGGGLSSSPPSPVRAFVKASAPPRRRFPRALTAASFTSSVGPSRTAVARGSTATWKSKVLQVKSVLANALAARAASWFARSRPGFSSEASAALATSPWPRRCRGGPDVAGDLVAVLGGEELLDRVDLLLLGLLDEDDDPHVLGADVGLDLVDHGDRGGVPAARDGDRGVAEVGAHDDHVERGELSSPCSRPSRRPRRKPTRSRRGRGP